MFALDVGCSEKRSLLRWASKPVALGIEASCNGHRSQLLFLHSKTPASTHLTEEPIYLSCTLSFMFKGFERKFTSFECKFKGLKIDYTITKMQMYIGVSRMQAYNLRFFVFTPPALVRVSTEDWSFLET